MHVAVNRMIHLMIVRWSSGCYKQACMIGIKWSITLWTCNISVIQLKLCLYKCLTWSGNCFYVCQVITHVFTGLDRFIVIVKLFTAFWKESKWTCQTEQESLHVWAKALVSLVVNMNVCLGDKCCFESQQTERHSGFLSQQSLWLLMPIRNKFNTRIHTGQCLFLDVFMGCKVPEEFYFTSITLQNAAFKNKTFIQEGCI